MLTCMSSIHFPFSFNSQTPFKQFNRPEGSKLYPLFPSFVCFTLCHPFPKVGDERPLFCPKFPVTHLNFLFIGAARNRCALHMFGFIVCFVSSRTKFNVFSNLSKMLFIYLKCPVSLHILQSDQDGYSQRSRSAVSLRRRERSPLLSRSTIESQCFSKFHRCANALDFHSTTAQLGEHHLY